MNTRPPSASARQQFRCRGAGRARITRTEIPREQGCRAAAAPQARIGAIGG